MDENLQRSEPGPTSLDGTPDTPQPSNRLFFGPEGLRPFWCLLLYVLILTIPIAALSTLSHLAHADSAGEKHTMLPPFTSCIIEWTQFAIVFFATWVMSRIENRDVFDYGLARSSRRIY